MFVPSDTDPCASDRQLISLEEARHRTAALIRPIAETERSRLEAALNRILAEDIIAQTPVPPFDQSAMDGYALRSLDAVSAASVLRIVPRQFAADPAYVVGPNEAVRVMTGMPVPAGTDSVVMQEHTRQVVANEIIVDGPIRRGANLRQRGEDIEFGETVLKAPLRLDGRHIAFLASQGIEEIAVRRRCRVAIVSTGNELRQPGEARGSAGIYDSNRPMLLALAREAGLEVIDGGCLRDDENMLAGRLAELARICDLLITTGGTSAGEEDFTQTAIAAAGGSSEKLQIALKPGKPAVIGNIGRAVCLGLPGNPVASLVGWLALGSAALASLGGFPHRPFVGPPLRSASDYERRPGRREFVPARVISTSTGTTIEILGKGGSARLKPLLSADGLADISADCGAIKAGDLIGFHGFGWQT